MSPEGERENEMKNTFRRATFAAIAASGLAIAASPAQAKEFYKLSSLAPGATPYVLNTTFAKIVQKYNKDIEIQVNATGIVPRHALDVATGKAHFFMAAPSVYDFMSRGIAMYKKNKKAPELAKNIRSMFNYRIGYYQAVVYADSGMKSLHDLKGKKVFLGPPAAVARVISRSLVEGVTGLKAGKDYTVVKLGFGAARQAFQDRQIDVLFDPSNPPSASVAQVALTNKIRILGLEEKDWKQPLVQKALKVPGRSRGQFAADAYGKNQVNTKPVQTLESWVGLGTHKDLPEEVIYKMVKTFWEHVDEMHAVAPWAKDAIQLKYAFNHLNIKLHPGAYRYYKEKGLKILDAVKP